MVKKRGIDIRNGNWLFYDNQLLTVDDTSPEELEGILGSGTDAIASAAEALYEKNRAVQPNSAQHPWLHVVRLASYADAFTSGLTAAAENPGVHHENNNYPRTFIRPEVHPYLDAVRSAGLVWRVPGRMQGWSEARDGLWLQAKTPAHHAMDGGSLAEQTPS